MGLACVREREDAAHPGPQPATVDKVCDLRQITARDLHEKEGGGAP
jgi:hypothetical protein